MLNLHMATVFFWDGVQMNKSLGAHYLKLSANQGDS
jgi:hypothetical protein